MKNALRSLKTVQNNTMKWFKQLSVFVSIKGCQICFCLDLGGQTFSGHEFREKSLLIDKSSLNMLYHYWLPLEKRKEPMEWSAFHNEANQVGKEEQ